MEKDKSLVVSSPRVYSVEKEQWNIVQNQEQVEVPMVLSLGRSNSLPQNPSPFDPSRTTTASRPRSHTEDIQCTISPSLEQDQEQPTVVVQSTIKSKLAHCCCPTRIATYLLGEKITTQDVSYVRELLGNAAQSTWLALFLLGVCASTLAWTIDEAASYVAKSHKTFTALGNQNYFFIQFALYLTFRTLAVFAAVLVTTTQSPNAAAGSGIPEMKCILGGFSLPSYLTLRTLVGKSVGLVLALGSGLSIGKEGPFVHLCCIIAAQLIKLFSDIKNHPDLTRHVLSAASAVGVTATFGAPIGGVLFSIEVTTVYYMTRTYWKAFFSSVVTVVVFKRLNVLATNNNNTSTGASLFSTSFQEFPYKFYEVFFFVILAIICGILGGVFVKCYSSLLLYKRNSKNRFFSINHRYASAMIVCIVFGCIEYPVGSFMVLRTREAIDDLLLPSSLNSNTTTHLERHYGKTWESPSLVINLTLYAVVRFFSTVAAATVAIPSGIVTPVFSIGAAVGRVFGEILSYVIGGSNTAVVIYPGGYALVAAASFTASVTGTVSIAVIVFELTSQLSYMVPVLLSVLIGRSVGRMVASSSIYAVISKDKNLPTWPDLSSQSSYALRAVDLMKPVAVVVYRHQTIESLEALLKEEASTFAVVDDDISMLYLGVATRVELTSLIAAWRTYQQSHSADDDDTTTTTKIDLTSLDLIDLDKLNYRVSSTEYASQVVLLMSVYKSDCIYVTKRGRLVGSIHSRDLTSGTTTL